jgi:hypothetical protein
VGSPLLDETRAILITRMPLYMLRRATVPKGAARGDKPTGTEPQTIEKGASNYIT